MNPRDIARFWIKAKPLQGEDACWEWQGGLLGSGYGQFKYGGQPQYAHRIAWQLIHGSAPPEGKQICHRCDNKICVNPDHLFVGSSAENTADALEKRRRPQNGGIERRGENSNFCKLTDKKVLEIREMRSQGFPMRVIAKKFGVSRPAISLIVNRKNWTHI